MTKEIVKQILKKFWISNFNKALVLDAILFTIVSLLMPWTTPVLMILFIVLWFRLKELRQLSPNRSLLLLFAIISNALAVFWTYFFISTILLIGLMFIPDRKWGIKRK